MLVATVLYNLLFFSLGWRMPAIDTHLQHQDISSELLTNFTLFSEYSAAATCEANFNSQGSKVVCDPGVCPVLDQTDTTVIAGFVGCNPGNVTGFLAVDRTNALIVLSFRGTRTLGNWITDFEWGQVPICGICPGCQVHHGYYYAWGNFSQHIMPSVNQLASQYPDYSIVFTGHSFGGALATLGAVFQEIPGKLINLYSTTSPEYWITSGNGMPVNTSDIQEIVGIDNKSGNLGTTGLNLADHNWYIGNMSGCATN
ncbi:hypothetical protein CNMCM5623_000586 [Aspergillus felis]|uniref:feruloyl esterase n=1 Tax=Aspergillus felis TaxID=1287682 RepID=A0A8H6Q7E1_9EURO|nr:hypothetical protein CNMCM5623_000586 [Aspergillus felis]KAF7183025.1 hypothetical protein CNMCM7691_002860 [Aspergillus felis]